MGKRKPSLLSSTCRSFAVAPGEGADGPAFAPLLADPSERVNTGTVTSF